MDNKFWKMMDQVFLILIEVTGEKKIFREEIHPVITSHKTGVPKK